MHYQIAYRIRLKYRKNLVRTCIVHMLPALTLRHSTRPEELRKHVFYTRHKKINGTLKNHQWVIIHQKTKPLSSLIICLTRIKKCKRNTAIHIINQPYRIRTLVILLFSTKHSRTHVKVQHSTHIFVYTARNGHAEKQYRKLENYYLSLYSAVY